MNNKHVDDCDRSEFTLDQPITYQIKIAGHPNENWSDWVDQMDIQIETDPSGLATTILIGCFDQAALLGLLRCLYHLEYPLMSVNCVKAHPINSDLRIPENPLELEPIQIIQPQYNLLYREEEREMLPLCIDQNIAVAPWAPLGQGVLTGRYTREQLADSPRSGGEDLQHWFLREKDFEIIDRLVEVAQKKGTTPAQIALAWVFSKNVITTPIIGVSKIKHLEQAVEALEIELSSYETEYLEELYQPRDLIGHHGGQPMAGVKNE